MNKTEFAGVVAGKIEMTKKDALIVVDAVLEAIQEELANGGNVDLYGFGKFSVAERAARKGRNPQDGSEIDIKASKVPKFKAMKGLKDAVKG